MAGLAVTVFNPLRQLFASAGETAMPGWRELVSYARWCPTVHNLQPHKIKIISATEAELYYDPARLLPVGDPGSIFATVALGIFHEHLSIAAAKYRKAVVMSEISAPVSTGNTGLILFARLEIVNATASEELDRELFLKRRTSRLQYDGQKLSDVTIGKMKKEAEHNGHAFFFSSDQALVNSIVDLNQEVLFEDLASKPNNEELNQLFRYSEKEAAEKKDGLWSRCMGFPGILMSAVFRHPDKWLHGTKKKFLAGRYKRSFKGTSTLCWFGSKFNNTEDWLQAGRIFARNWLILTRDNAYLQPFGSLITNAAANKTINTILTRPNEDKKIWLIFRAGYSKEPSRSFRLDTDQIIIQL